MLVQGTLQLPGDKSISHRAIMLSAIADGVSYVRNLNDGADLKSTINILKEEVNITSVLVIIDRQQN